MQRYGFYGKQYEVFSFSLSLQKSYLKRCKPKQAKELRSFLYRYPLLFFFPINICYSTDKNYFFCCFTGSITVSYLITYHRQIEHLCQFGIFTVHHNGKQIIRMDPEVIILCYLLPIVIRHILQVRNLFLRRTTRQDTQYKGYVSILLHVLFILSFFLDQCIKATSVFLLRSLYTDK